MESVLNGLGLINESICCGPICGGGGGRGGGARGAKVHDVCASSAPPTEEDSIKEGSPELDVEQVRSETPPPQNQCLLGGNVGADESPTSVVQQLTTPPDLTATDHHPPDLVAEGTPSDKDDGAAKAEERDEAVVEEGDEDGIHEEWEHARTSLTASPWSAYLRGERRPKLFGAAKTLYSEFRTRAPAPSARRTATGLGAGEIATLNGLAGAVARSIDEVGGVRNLQFTPDKCLWKADYVHQPSTEAREGAEGNALDGGSVGSEEYRLNVRIYSLDDEALGGAERKWKDERRGEEGGGNMEDFVITVRILGGTDEGTDANKQRATNANKQRAFRALESAIRSAAIWHELPAYLEDSKGGKTRRQFADEYDLGRELNSGAYAKVYMATCKATGDVRAVKVIDRAKLVANDSDVTAVLFEVLLQSSLADHRNVVRLHDFYDEADSYYLVMEYMSGGDLFDRIGDKKTYSERDARDLVRNLLVALVHCHGMGVVHRDLKPKNMMLVDNSSDTSIKLADFGLSARTVGPKTLLRLCGSPFYVAPELLLKQPYDESSDMWSVGAIAYLLLGGAVPFSGTSMNEIFRKILNGRYNFESECWAAVSREAKDFVRSLLKREASERPTAEDALNQAPWFRVEDKVLERNGLQKSAASLRGFEARMKFKPAVFAVQGMQRLAAGNKYQWQYGLEGINEDGNRTADI